MLELLADPAAARFAFVLGIVLSVVVYDRLHLTTGSIIVPGYIAINLWQPHALVMTMCNVLAAYMIVYVVLPRFVLLDKSEKFLTVVLISVLLRSAGAELLQWTGLLVESDPIIASIGYVIPGLIAYDIAAQGVRYTVTSAVLMAVVVAGITLGVIMMVPGVLTGSGVVPQVDFLLELRWLPQAILFSALASILIKRNFGYKCGGFVGAAYVSLMLNHPGELLQLAALSVLTWCIVRFFLMPRLVLFGRRKFSAMLLVAAVLTWGAMTLRESVLGHAPSPLTSDTFALVGITLTGLFANDLQRVGPLGVLRGAVMAVAFTLTATMFVQEAAIGTSLATLLFLGTVLVFVSGIIFGPQLAWLCSRIASGSAKGKRSAAFGVKEATQARRPWLTVCCVAAVALFAGGMASVLPTSTESRLVFQSVDDLAAPARGLADRHHEMEDETRRTGARKTERLTARLGAIPPIWRATSGESP